MIITVTLNAAIDKTLAVPNFRLGRRHRAVEQTAMAGGKGVNVARALRALGQPVIATGVAGGPTGTRIVEHLTDEGILNDFVRIREESRTSTAVVDPTSGEQTEINEHGPHVSEAELDLFVDKLLYLAKGAAVCVFAGSLPRGVDADLYGRLIEEMRRLDVTTVLDSEGEPLVVATRKGPDVVTPNELEAEGLVGREFADLDDRRRALEEMVEMGAREGVMTLPDGCMAVLGEGGEQAAVPRDPGAARAGFVGGVGGRLPGRLRGGPLRRSRRPGLLALRGGLRRRVDPAFRRRAGRAARGRAAAAGGPHWRRSERPQFPRRALSRPLLRSGFRPPSNLGSPNGSRDRPGQEGPPRIRLR